MAVVGEAKVIIRAVTDRAESEILSRFRNLDNRVGDIGNTLGRSLSNGIGRGVGRGAGGVGGNNIIARFFGSDFASRAEDARKRLRSLTLATFFLTSGLGALVGAIGSIVGPLLSLGIALAQASRTAIVLVQVLGSLGQAAIVAAAGFRGVFRAIGAGLQQQRAGTNATNQQAAAIRRLNDARENLRRLIEEEKPEALAAAQERAAEAADAAADALRNAEEAEEDYFEAQVNTLEALQDLNKAREEARERIQQLRFETEDAAISEARARIEFEKARETLQAVQDLPPNSRARQEAELAFAEADLNLRRAIDRNADLKKAEQEATRAGVEGSDEVLRAKKNIERAYEREEDAAFSAARARRDAEKAAADAARAAADAAAGGRVEREFDRRIAEARQAVLDAEEALRSGAGGADAFAEAMSNLSEEAQAFVNFIVKKFIPAIRPLSGAAGRRLFQPLQEGLQLIIDRVPQLIPLFERTGGIIGELSKSFLELFFSAENFGRTEAIWRINDDILDRLGKTVLNLVDGLLELYVAAEPVIDAFLTWALNSSTGWLGNLKEDTDGVTASFTRALDAARRIFGILGTIGDSFGILAEASSGPGGAVDVLLSGLQERATNFKETLEELNRNGQLREILVNLTENGLLLFDVLSDIGGVFIELGQSEGTKEFLTSLKDIGEEFRNSGFWEDLGAKGGPIDLFGEFLENVSSIFIALNDSGAIETFFNTLNPILEAIAGWLRDENNQKLINFFAQIAAVGLALGLVFRPIKEVGLAVLGTIGLISNMIGGLATVAGFFKAGGPIAKGVAAIGAALGIGGGVAGGAARAAGIGGAAVGGGLLSRAGGAIKDFFAPNSQGAQARSFGRAATAFAPKAGGLLAKGALRAGITAASGPAAPIVGAAMLAWTAYDVIKMVGDSSQTQAEQSWQQNTSWWDSNAKPWFNSRPQEVQKSTMGTWNFLGAEEPKKTFPGALNWYGSSVDPWLKNRPGAAANATQGFYNWLGPQGGLQPAFNQATGLYSSSITPWLSNRPGEANNLASGFYNWAGTAGLGPQWAQVPLYFNGIVLPYFLQITRIMQVIGSAMWRGLLGNFPQVVTIIVAGLNLLAAALNPFIALFNQVQTLRGAGGRLSSLPSLAVRIPGLADGGVIMPRAGGMLAVIGEGGRAERVEPLDPDGLSKRDKAIIDRLSGGGGATINVYPSAGMNEQELAKKVSRELAYQLRRGAV